MIRVMTWHMASVRYAVCRILRLICATKYTVYANRDRRVMEISQIPDSRSRIVIRVSFLPAFSCAVPHAAR